MAERYLTMSQLCSALKQQRVKEMFGSGTACMICPIGHIVYQGEVGERAENMVYESLNRKDRSMKLYSILDKNIQYIYIKMNNWMCESLRIKLINKVECSMIYILQENNCSGFQE